MSFPRFDSDDESEETKPWLGSAGCVVMINIADTDKAAKNLCFDSVRDYLKACLSSSSPHLIGICLFGTKETKLEKPGLENLIELVKLDKPTLETYKYLQSVSIDSIKETKDYNLSEVLWQCRRMFSNCTRKMSEKTVFFLSKFDKAPPTKDARPSLKQAFDFRNLGINLKLVDLDTSSNEIDPFFEELMVASHTAHDVSKKTPKVNTIEDLIKLLQQRSHRHLATSRLEFIVGDGVTIGVGIFNLITTKQMPKSENLESESNEIVSKTRQIVKVAPSSNGDFEVNNQKPMLQSEFVYYTMLGNEKIEFSKDELSKIKNAFGKPSLKLMGFKPKTVLCKEKWYWKPSSFLFPNETSIEGSTKVFKALHKACGLTETIALCFLCTRVNATPKLVALSPCTNPLGLDVEIGFDIIYIPYLENIKDVPPSGEGIEFDETNGQHITMKEIIDALKIKYNPKMFVNPKLQSLNHVIEGLALGEVSEKPVDTTKPNSKTFEEVDSEWFNKDFGPFSVGAAKRTYSNNKDSEGPSKKPCVEVSEDEIQYFKGRLQTEQIEKYNVADLKKFLKYFVPSGLPALTNLKKNDLVRMVYEKVDANSVKKH